MDRLIIRGGRRLEGSVQIRGAKNAVLPQIAAALLSSAPLEITNVPDVSDVTTMLALLQEFGVTTQIGRNIRRLGDALDAAVRDQNRGIIVPAAAVEHAVGHHRMRSAARGVGLRAHGVRV